jgi:hypothetical protein
MEGSEIWISFRRVWISFRRTLILFRLGFDFLPTDLEFLPRVWKVGKGRSVDRFGVAALQTMSFFRNPFRPSTRQITDSVSCTGRRRTEAVKYTGRGRQRVGSFLYLADPAGCAFLGRPAAKG